MIANFLDDFIKEYLDNYKLIYLSGSFNNKKKFDKFSDIDLIVLGDTIDKDFHQYIEYKDKTYDIIHLPKRDILKTIEYDSIFFGGIYNNILKGARVIRDEDNYYNLIQQYIEFLDLNKVEYFYSDNLLQCCLSIKEQLVDLNRSQNTLESILIINSILDSIVYLELVINGANLYDGKWKAYSLKLTNEELYNNLNKLISDFLTDSNYNLVTFIKEYLRKFDYKYSLKNSSSVIGFNFSDAKINSYLLKFKDLAKLLENRSFFSENFYVEFLNGKKIRDYDIILHLYGQYSDIKNKYILLTDKLVYQKKMTFFLGGEVIEDLYFNSLPDLLYLILYKINIINYNNENRRSIGIDIILNLDYKNKSKVLELLVHSSLYRLINNLDYTSENNFHKSEVIFIDESNDFFNSYKKKSHLTKLALTISKKLTFTLNSINLNSKNNLIENSKLIDYVFNFFSLSLKDKYLIYSYCKNYNDSQ